LRKKYPLLDFERDSIPAITVNDLDITISQEKIQYRRKRINQLRLRGYTNQEIAVKIGCSASTIEKDLHIIREKSREWFEDQSITEYCQSLHDAIILCDNASEDLQIMYNDESSSEVKSRILVLMAEMEIRKSTLYEKTLSVQKYLRKDNPAIIVKQTTGGA